MRGSGDNLFFWAKNKKWSVEDPVTGEFTLTDEAPLEARISFAKWLKYEEEYEKNVKKGIYI
jgi:hypothetical protein